MWVEVSGLTYLKAEKWKNVKNRGEHHDARFKIYITAAAHSAGWILRWAELVNDTDYNSFVEKHSRKNLQCFWIIHKFGIAST